MSDFLLNLARRSGGYLPKAEISPAFVPYFLPTQGVASDKVPGRKSAPLQETTQNTSMDGTEDVSPLLDRSFHPVQRKNEAENPIEFKEQMNLEPSSSLSYGRGRPFQAHDPFHELGPKQKRVSEVAPASPSPTLPVRSDALPQMGKETDPGATNLEHRTEVIRTRVGENGLERMQTSLPSLPDFRPPSPDPRKVIKPEKTPASQRSRLKNDSLSRLGRDATVETKPVELQYQHPEKSYRKHPIIETEMRVEVGNPSHPDPGEGPRMHSEQETEELVGLSTIQPRQAIIHEMEETTPSLIQPAEIPSIPTFIPESTKSVPPPVRVHIGTVEVLAATPPQPPSAKPAPKPEGFKDYMLIRNYMSRERLGY
jgi:hypothetical protein